VWWSRLKSQEVRQRKVLAVAGVVRLKDYQLQATVGLRSPDRINNRNDLNLWAQLNKTRTYTLVGWLVEYNNRLLKIEKAQDSRCELSCSSLEGSTCWLDSTDSALQAGQTPCQLGNNFSLPKRSVHFTRFFALPLHRTDFETFHDRPRAARG
jgi:hypothetical protein